MKKWLILIGIIGVLCLGYLGLAHLSGGAYPTMGIVVGGARGELRQLTLEFIEDIKFKDFKKAASYHDPKTQEQVDVPFLLQRLFVVKPEALDVISYEIVFAEIDSTNLRGRVKARIKFKDLIKNQIREREVIYFYHRDSLNDPWYMKLESSLRRVEGDDKKKH